MPLSVTDLDSSKGKNNNFGEMWPSCSRKKLRELSNLAPIDKAPFLLSFDVETVERSNYIVDREEAHESGDQVEPSFFHSGGIDRRVSPRDRATSLASSPVFTTPCSLSPLPSKVLYLIVIFTPSLGSLALSRYNICFTEAREMEVNRGDKDSISSGSRISESFGGTKEAEGKEGDSRYAVERHKNRGGREREVGAGCQGPK